MRALIRQFILGIFVLAILGLIVLNLIHNLKIEDYEEFNGSFRKAVYGSGKQALVDFHRERCSHKMDCIYSIPGASTGDSLTLFSLRGKKGFLSCNTGNIVIAATYDDAWQFDSESNLAAVCTNNKLGFINKSGIIVIPAIYPYIKENFDDEDEFVFQNGTCKVPNLNKIGLINAKGETVLPAVYTSISSPCKGYRIIMIEDKAGLFDVGSSKIVWPLQFEYLEFADNGIVVTDTLQQCHLKYMVSYDLKTRVSVYDDVTALFAPGDEYQDGEYTGYSTFTIDGKVGILDDDTGKELFPALYDDVSYYANDKFKATTGDYMVLIDHKGNMLGQESNKILAED